MSAHPFVFQAHVDSAGKLVSPRAIDRVVTFSSDGEALDLEAGGGGASNVVVQATEPTGVAINTLWVEIDNAVPPNVIAIHVAVA